MKTYTEKSNGWTDFVSPKMEGYRLACCDCGLVHDLQFRVVEVLEHLPNGTWVHSDPLDPSKYKIQFRARRNRRSTAQIRRHKPNADVEARRK